jgi:hypothetical protein
LVSESIVYLTVELVRALAAFDLVRRLIDCEYDWLDFDKFGSIIFAVFSLVGLSCRSCVVLFCVAIS